MEIFPGLARFRLLRLLLADGAYGVLHLLVGPFHDVLRLAFRLVQDLLPHLPDILQFLLVFSGDALQRLVRISYFLDFLVQYLSVSRNLPQIPFNAHKLLTCTVFRVFDNRLRQPHLTCQLECEGVSRQPHFQFEQRCNVLGIELHRPVHDARVRP